MANLCHPHEMTDLVDRFQNWRGFVCPYCRIATLDAALKRIEFELDGGIDAASRKARIRVVRTIIAGCFTNDAAAEPPA